ncbi:hypothetical protein D1007_62346 [Hordeum vulgare]|nr:hypothetical protein D1007_62346 [Hordeum vulgare]
MRTTATTTTTTTMRTRTIIRTTTTATVGALETRVPCIPDLCMGICNAPDSNLPGKSSIKTTQGSPRRRPSLTKWGVGYKGSKRKALASLPSREDSQGPDRHASSGRLPED